MHKSKSTDSGDHNDQQDQQPHLKQYRSGTTGKYLIGNNSQGEPLSVAAEIVHCSRIVIILLTASIEITTVGRRTLKQRMQILQGLVVTGILSQIIGHTVGFLQGSRCIGRCGDQVTVLIYQTTESLIIKGLHA